ncbi:Phosphatidylinositol N-acetylglucosaminyltransferase subunit C [Kalmanozyma brasiliensis GHG001]|uniref:Phosphatidylinositol N-acetylglucosaminyltransferase subunit C n=1 Tax=Kalmanozyma brasiliensis (strain GHG001) TaxID=1365824 RepID=UPI0028681DEC|nr:Phosphatidylinositol N-acetylglucosaminyltransferase subunit C [Kalmanozyma brasiliensis GHG001]KAF6766946.1 Phosphatidylinositol N-acetylglucosaminyltransferase subunit C [Kalmanozyma brasiliensis GHG001]
MSTTTPAPAADQVQFEKVLWRKQPFADNFVPPSFLSDLRTNSQVVLPSFAELVVASLRISTRFLSVILFALLFVHLHLSTLDSEVLLLLTLLAFLLLSGLPSFSTFASVDRRTRRKRAVSSILTKTIMALVLLAVSPVLRTLTESTTSDSIWALSVMLFTLHLVLADYSAAKGGGKLSSTLSFNAAISASVVLASRLKTDSESFTLLALAVLLFAPTTWQGEGNGWGEGVRCATMYVLTMVTGLLFAMTGQGGWVWVVGAWVNVAVLFVSLVCPWWITRAQRWKMEIKGPWDPAEPILSSRTR